MSRFIYYYFISPFNFLVRTIQLFRCTNSKFFNILPKCLQINFILFLRLGLRLECPENAHRRRKIVQPPGSLQGSPNNRDGRDEIVAETVVETALEFEEVGGGVEVGGPAGDEIVNVDVLFRIWDTSVA